MAFLDIYADILKAFSHFSGQLGARPDYVQGGGGNTSVKLDDYLMAIKASGYCLEDIRPDKAYAVINYAALRRFYAQSEPGQYADVEAAGAASAKAAQQQIEGLDALRPSVEAGFHSLLDTYVGHTHSVYANLAACCKEADEVLQNALDGADYTGALVPYINPGAELTFTIRDAMRYAKAESGRAPSVLLLQNHGIISHDNSNKRCLQIHEDINNRFINAFGLEEGAFPAPAVKETADGTYLSDTPWLHSRLAGDAYPDAFLLDSPLYPDQMVFFKGTLGEKALINRTSGVTHYHLPRKTAQTIEETLCAVVFIIETIRRRGLTLVTMGESAKGFIGGWESEKYRKSLAEGKA